MLPVSSKKFSKDMTGSQVIGDMSLAEVLLNHTLGRSYQGVAPAGDQKAGANFSRYGWLL